MHTPTLASEPDISPLDAGGFRRIVVGLDGSARAADALALAQALRDPGDGTLVLAHIKTPASFRLARRRATTGFACGFGDARMQLDGRVAATECVRPARSVPRGLADVAAERLADLVVLGSQDAAPRGRTSASRTALRLLQEAGCAISIAPAGWRDSGRFRHIGIAYDGSSGADAALAAGYRLATRDGAAVSLYYVNVAVTGATTLSGLSEREVDLAQQRTRLRAHERLDAAADAAPNGVNPRTVLLHGDPAREITTAADGIIDILLTGSRGLGPMQRALTGSVSEALLLASTTYPIVAVGRAD